MNRIILHIPHSTPCTDFSRWSDPSVAEREHDQWTDWFTGTIFSPVDNPDVIPAVFPMSRYDLDVERVIGDPMEQCGQGIIYSSTRDGRSTRELSVPEKVALTRKYADHVSRMKGLCSGKGLLIDCHSFPTMYTDAPNAHGTPVDICIGYNDDPTYPGDRIVEIVKRGFGGQGYTVGINEPFSNSFAPLPDFPSVMIEIRKGVYMDEGTRKLLPSAYKLNQLLNGIYREILST